LEEFIVVHKVIDPETGIKRDARDEDFLITNNDNIKRAFEMLARWHKQWLWEQKSKAVSDSNEAYTTITKKVFL